jgi:hypothetical protein
MAVQKSLIPRVQFWVTSKVAHSARQSQGQVQVRVSGRAKPRVKAGPGRRAMAGPRAQGTGRWPSAGAGPVPGAGAGQGRARPGAGAGAGVGQGQGQGEARAQGDGQVQVQVQGRCKVRPGAGADHSSQCLLAQAVFGGPSPEALPWQCFPVAGQFPGGHGLARGGPCAGSTFPGAGMPNRLWHCWGGHCWARLPAAGPPVAELAQLSADPVVNRTVPMGLALFTDSIVLVSR